MRTLDADLAHARANGGVFTSPGLFPPRGRARGAAAIVESVVMPGGWSLTVDREYEEILLLLPDDDRLRGWLADWIEPELERTAERLWNELDPIACAERDELVDRGCREDEAHDVALSIADAEAPAIWERLLDETRDRLVREAHVWLREQARSGWVAAETRPRTIAPSRVPTASAPRPREARRRRQRTSTARGAPERSAGDPEPAARRRS